MEPSNQWNEFVELRKHLDPSWQLPQPVPAAKLRVFQKALGFRIPDALLEGIGICAGAFDAWSEPLANEGEEFASGAPDVQEGEEDTFDYGEVSFLTLENIVDEYETRRNLATQLASPEIVVGPVRARYFDKRWIPIAQDVGTGRFAIDLNPEKGGVSGQIIWAYDEGSIVRVVSSSLGEFLAYGSLCLRYELGELQERPVPSYRHHESTNVADETIADVEGLRVVSLWKRIVSAAKSKPASPVQKVEFHKPASTEQVDKVEKRLKVSFPAQLRHSFLTMNNASGMWLQPGKFGSYPINLCPLSDAVGFSGAVRRELRNGNIAPKELPELPDSLALVGLAGAGWIREQMTFYVVCSAAPHALEGKVLMRYSESDTQREVLTFFADDVASFLEQGLAKM